MEISSFNCLADLGMEDPFLMPQWPHVDSIDGLSSISSASTFSDDYNFDYYQSYNNNNNNNNSHPPVLDFKRPSPESTLVDDYSNFRPSKQVKTVKNDGHSYSHPSLSSVGLVDSVGFVKPEEKTWNFSSSGNQNYVLKSGQGAKRVSSGTNGNRLAQDHIMAERKRREKLSQRFIALSTLVPGLKKMDKASVLGDAITHIKQLQEKVKALEEQTRKKPIESMVFVRKYEVHHNWADSGDNLTSEEPSISTGPTTTRPLPEIEARFCDRDVLVNIHCEKQKGVLEKAVAEIEKLNLSVVNSSIMSFGDAALNITVVAQKDEDFGSNMKDFVKNLRATLKILG